MRDTLYIRWRDPAKAPLHYVVGDATALASVRVDEGSLDDIQGRAAGCRVIVFVPAGDVRLTSVEVPARQAGKAQQAIPFLLEEHLADEVEDLHFALGPRQRGTLGQTEYPVAIVSHTNMDRWLAPLRERGIAPDVVVPEMLCLPPPTTDGAWHALLDPGEVIVRNAQFAGFSCAPDDFPLLLSAAEGGDGPHPLRILLAGDASVGSSVEGHAVELLPGYADPLQALVRHYQPDRAINLLQGPYSRRESIARLWRPWRYAAALALLVFVTAVAVNGIWAMRLDHQAAAQNEANAQRFHRLFPNEPRSLALSLAMQQQLRRLSGGTGPASGLLTLLQPTAAALASAKGLQVREIQFRDRGLYLDLDGSDLQALDRLRSWFSSHSKVHLTVQSADVSGDHVRIRIKVAAS